GTLPSGAFYWCANRTGRPRGGHDRIELVRAACVQPSTGLVGLVQQRTEVLQVPLSEQLRAEPSARGLADHVQRPGAKRLGERSFEAWQPRRRPAREPAKLRQFEREPCNGRLALGPSLVEGARGELPP